MIKIDVMCCMCVYVPCMCVCHVCVYAMMYVCICAMICHVCAVCVLWSAMYVLYVCYDLPCMCCMCAMICHVCVYAMYVCHPIAVSVPKPQETVKSAQKVKRRQKSKIPWKHENQWNPWKQAVYYRPLYTTFHFANDRPSGGPILRFRCTTPHETVIFDPPKSTHSPFFGFGAPFRVQEHFFGKKRLPKGIIVHKKWPFFHFRKAPEHDFRGFSWFSWFSWFSCTFSGFEGYSCQTVIFVYFSLFFGFWIQILDLLGLPPTWYLLASISRRKLATHIPWTLSHHGCYVASSNELDDAKTIQIFASWLT